ncbi:RHS repeat-associated core domain-containing protein [Pseudoalteromonas sp. T1lg23B]|uniref:RHS repeat-associated core domain-containing protein n=1 Tax=Pseudoalteromonas sp. T1lg23B TaxID=2077097 RepID=UPI001319CBE6|nr:RHS repeat-associated core domain-containing protein [Pseudoalteromonas sp. T1lg23B]
MKRYNVGSEVTADGSDVAGDQLAMSNGSLSFMHMDVSIPGNSGLDVSVHRSFSPTRSFGASENMLGDWQLELPRIEARTIVDLDGFISPFYDDDRNNIYNNCEKAISYEISDSGYRYTPEAYTSGLNLIVPNRENAKLMLKGVDPYDWKEQPVTKYVTQSNWEVTCDSTRHTFGEGSYQGFVAKSPDGTKYYFNQLVFKKSNYVETFSSGKDPDSIKRPFVYEVHYYVDKVVDKFGNWVEYTYEAHTTDVRLEMPSYFYPKKLTQITSNDGRQVSLAYKDMISIQLDSITAGSKTWEYVYDNGKLTEVKLPEGKSWKFDFARKLLSRTRLDRSEECLIQDQNELSLSVTTPNLATVAFKLQDTIHGRTGIEELYDSTDRDPEQKYPLLKRCIQTLSLKEKKITAGSEIYTWKYDYSQNAGSFLNVAKPGVDEQFSSDLNLALGDVKYTKVTAPDMSVSYHFFDRRSLINEANHTKNPYENKEILTLYRNKDGADLKKVHTEYILGDYLGWTGMGRENTATHTSYIHMSNRKVTLLDGTNETIYNTNILSYDDAFGEPTLIEYYFDPENKKYIQRGFRHDLSTWSLNLPETIAVSEDKETFTVAEEYKYAVFTNVGPTSAGGVLLPSERHLHGSRVEKFASYHNNGLLRKVILGANDNTNYVEFADYKAGVPQTATMPNRYGSGTISRKAVVDDFGLVTEVTDLNDVITKYGYDDLGRITSIDLANDADMNWLDTKFSWNDANNTRTIKRCELNASKNCVDTASVETVETYDQLLRLVQTKITDLTTYKDPFTSTRYQNFRYDFEGRQTFASVASNTSAETKGQTTLYDSLGRKQRVSVSGLGSKNFHYLNNNRIKVTNPLGNVTTTTYQAFGAPSYDVATFIDSPEEVDTSIEVNLFGLVESVTQSGKSSKDNTVVSATESRYYDVKNQLCLIVRPEFGNTLFHYNELGQLVWKKDGVTNTSCVTSKPTGATDFQYDNIGSLHRINYPSNSGTPSVTYTLDNNGNLTTLVSGNVSHSYGYNSQNLLEFERLTITGQLPLEIDHGYNALQHASYLAYPDGTTVQYSPNGFGEPTQAVQLNAQGNTVETEFATNANYYATGMLKSFTYGNGVVYNLTRNASNLLPDVLKHSKSGGDIVNLNYAFDNNLNVTSILDSTDSGFSLTSLNYDDLDRLTSVSGGASIGNSAIRYDGLGNIESYQSKDRNLTYSYDRTKNRLLNVQGQGTGGKYGSIAYDNRGNVMNNGAYSLQFNLANQLVSAKGNSFLYDGHNRRVKQVETKGTSYSLYSQSGKLLFREESNNIAGEGINYIYLGNQLIAKYGHVTPRTSSVERQHYRPYGESIEEAPDDIGYTGHKFDKELGLNYMQARYYDPVIGRFYSNDPVGYTAKNPVMSFNRYMYVNNNPYKYTDPDGEFFNFALGAIGATVGAITGGVSSYMQSGGDWDATMKGAGVGAGIGLLAGVTGGTSLVGFGKAADMSFKASSASSALSTMGSSSLKMAATSGASNAAGQIVGGAEEVNMTQVATSAAGGLIPGAGAGAILASTGTKTVNSVAGTAIATVVADTLNVGTQAVANEVAKDLEKDKQ